MGMKLFNGSFLCLLMSYICHGYPLFQFGDSLSDTGNKVIAFPNASRDIVRPPYGMTFFHHPANRVSDGRLIIDFLATRLGLPFLRPYLESQRSFTNGVNFAVAGGTAVSVESYKLENLLIESTAALDTQLDWFLEFKQRTSGKFSAGFFEQALYIVGEIGGNDYGRMWEQGWSYERVEKFVDMVITSIETHIRSLYMAGGRRFMVVNLPLQGCNPRNFAMSPPDAEKDNELGCILKMKRIGEEHNLKLKAVVQTLQKDFKDAVFVYADFYRIMVEVMENLAAYGIKNGREACCGIFKQEIKVNCGETRSINSVALKGTACSNPSEYLFWNDNHFTEHFYEVVADYFLYQLGLSEIGPKDI